MSGDLTVWLEKPFQVRVTHYRPGTKGHPGRHDSRGNLTDPGDPPEPAEVEWELWADGQRQKWAEDLCEAQDIEYIREEILAQIEGEPMRIRA